jgi:hypothetical protein
MATVVGGVTKEVEVVRNTVEVVAIAEVVEVVSKSAEVLLIKVFVEF